jgi:hypothetical protein
VFQALLAEEGNGDVEGIWHCGKLRRQEGVTVRDKMEAMGKVAEAAKVLDREGDEGNVVLVRVADDIMGCGVVIAMSIKSATDAAKMGLMEIGWF